MKSLLKHRKYHNRKHDTREVPETSLCSLDGPNPSDSSNAVPRLAKPEVKFRLNEPDCHNSITDIDFQILRDLSYLSTDNNRGIQRLEFL